MSERKRVAVLGSTGSIGTQTLAVLEQFKDDFEVKFLAGGNNTELLDQQRSRWGLDERSCGNAVLNPQILEEFSTSEDVDIVINGVLGFAGFKATLASLRANKTIGHANKESLIAGGKIVREIMDSPNFSGQLIPVDSEHSAIWQCLKGEKLSEVDELVLTASGGPFRGKTKFDLENVTKEQALKHPTWTMGQKITIDSATLVNKGLEVIEAHEIFGIDYDQIKVTIHPQSIVHSMVTFIDGATMAQLSHPDMRLPIAIALGVDKRLGISIGKISFDEVLKLEFEPPDMSVFPGLKLCYEAGRIGQGAPAMLSAANEIAVEAFLSEKIGFYGITDVISDVLQEGIEKVDVEEDVYEADRIARERAAVFVEKRSR